MRNIPFDLDRRRFMKFAVGSLIGGQVALAHSRAARTAEQAAKSHGPVRITEIEVHEITVPYQDWLADPLNHFYGPTKRVVYVAHTDVGLIGLGEGHNAEPKEVIQQYIGTNPFDWVGDETSLGLGTAMYDLMGKVAGVPVYKLFGQRYRRWVPKSAWTVSTDPRHMAEAVRRYAADGHTRMKYHLSPFENVFDQLRAMQEVAPRGFKINFDLTMGGTDDHIPDLLNRIAEFPIAGSFEDPLNEKDIEGYVRLRRRSRLPIVLHHSPLDFTFDVLGRAGDAYIVGHAKIGDAIRRAGLFAAANAPFTLQNTGGMVTTMMTVHMQAAFKTASFPLVSTIETWKDDVVEQRLNLVNGLVRVPEGPGLGVTLSRAALNRLKQLRLPQQAKWIIKTRYDNGTTMYNIADPKQSIFMVRPDRSRLAPMSYDAPLQTEYWDDDQTEAYRQMFARIEREGIVLVPGN